MRVDFLNPVLHACENVMSNMAGLRVHTGRPWRKDPQVPETGGTVTGLICMRSTMRCASIAVIFTDNVLHNISLRMLPADVRNKQDLVFDLAGELSNLIIGGAKSLLLQQGYDFQITLPTVIHGHDYLIAHRTHSPILRIPLDSDIGRFHIEASLEGPALTPEEKAKVATGKPEVELEVELF